MTTDAGNYTLTINGSAIRQFTGADVTPDGESSLNASPGGEGFSFNDQASANTASGTLNIRETSLDLEKVHEYARAKDDVEIQVVVTKNLDKYKTGRIIGWRAGLCRLQPAGQQFGTDSNAQDVTFGVLAIGFEWIRKA